MFNHNVLPRCKLASASKETARLPQFQFQLFLQKMKCWKWFDWSECCPANLNVNSNQYLQKLRSVHPPPITVILSSSSSGDRRCMGSKPEMASGVGCPQKKHRTIWHRWQFDTTDNLTPDNLTPDNLTPQTIWHRGQFDTGQFDTGQFDTGQFDTTYKNGQFDTADNLTPRTILHHIQKKWRPI